MLQHSGTMNRGESRLNVAVVLDSGTDELVGLGEQMTIQIEGEHKYVLEYTLGEDAQTL